MTPERLEKIKAEWKYANRDAHSHDCGTAISQEFAGEHFDELLAEIDRLRAENEKIREFARTLLKQIRGDDEN